MRHRVAGKKLGRTTSHRIALFSNMATALFEHDRIVTTETKAKTLKPIIEKLITHAKKNDLHHRRLVAKTVRNETVLKRLFDEIAPRYATRNGGYARVIKMGRRPGDAAFKALLELVDAPEKVKKEEVTSRGKQANAAAESK
jgi:large subunit ribosomal protein L17